MQNRFVRVVIRNPLGEVLALAEHRPGEGTVWNLPGGRVEAGETEAEAAIREVQEEMGIIIQNLNYLYEDNFIFNEAVWRGTFFEALAYTHAPILAEPDKGLEFGFFTPKALQNLPGPQEVLYKPVAFIKNRGTHA